MGKDTGRPTKYKKEYAEQARKICKLGATDLQLADIFGVAESTIYKWKLDQKEFSEALKSGKLTPIEEVERSLYEKATGYNHPDTHISNYQGEITTTPITKHYPPSDTAIIYYLNNLKPEKYRNKQEITHNVDESVLESLEKLYDSK